MNRATNAAWTWGLDQARALHEELVEAPAWDAEDLVFESRTDVEDGLDEAEELRDALYNDVWVEPLTCDCNEGHINATSVEYLDWMFEGEDHLAWIYRPQN